MATSDTDLLIRVKGLTSAMSYNDMIDGVNPKSLIRELCRRLDQRYVRIHKKKDGFLMIDNRGVSRFLSFAESWVWRCFKRPPAGYIVVTEHVSLE